MLGPQKLIGTVHGRIGQFTPKAKARGTHLDLLALWKDADPDIPILKQAKTESAKLQ